MILNETYTLENGLSIPKLGLGTWFIDDDQAAEAVRTAVKLGYRLIDTAQAYGNERGVGKGVRTCGVPREELFVASKVAAELKTYDEAKKSIDETLEKMGLDYLDQMIIHSPQPWNQFRVEKRYSEENKAVWRALEDAQSEGKVRVIGVSNFLRDDLENLLSDCRVKPMVNQILLHISNTDLALLDYCREQNIAVLAHSPLEHGLLTGKIGMDREFSPDELRGGKIWFAPANRGRVLQVLAGWSDLTAKYGCDLAQLVIAWTISQPGMTYTLCGARKPDQVRDNVGATRLVLDAADMQRMRRDVEALGDPQPA